MQQIVLPTVRLAIGAKEFLFHGRAQRIHLPGDLVNVMHKLAAVVVANKHGSTHQIVPGAVQETAQLAMML